MLAPEPRQDYSRKDVCRMLGITGQQLRGWERQGLIPAASGYSFSEIIALKTLQKLRENRIPARRIVLALAALKQKLSHVVHPLSELKILSDGRTITVHFAGQKMEAITGQMLFDFETADLEKLRPFSRKPERAAASREREAEFYFQHGLTLEETGAPIEQATEAYKKAVELNPSAAGALVNLGTIYYRARAFREAENYYRRAIEVDANYPLAHYNLGNLYDEEGDLVQAQQHYTLALGLNPSYADAHFNLALLFERTGDVLRAVRHWKAYLKMDNTGTWANIARRQLEKLRQSTVVPSR